MKATYWRRMLMLCASAAMMLALTACSGARLSVPAYAHPAQGHYLYLKGGQPIQTLRGDYTPVRDEKWVSPALLQEKDETILELNRALERAGVKPFLPKQ